MFSNTCSTETVKSRTHFASPPIAKAPPAPFLLKDRSSFAPTHLANQTARSMGMFLLRACSKSTLPLIPWGIDRLRRRSDMVGLARSLSHISLFVSVTVTRGGGLKVESAVIFPWALRWARTLVNNEDNVCRPLLCFKDGYMEAFAEPVSFCDICDLSKKPWRMTGSENWSSAWLPFHGKKSAWPIEKLKEIS